MSWFCVSLSRFSTSPAFSSPEEALAFLDDERPDATTALVHELEEVDPLSYLPFGSDLVRLLMDNLDGSIAYSRVDCETFPCEKEHANRLEALVSEAYGRWVSELRASDDWPLILDFGTSGQVWSKTIDGKWEPA